jgi:hypothetical protein
MDARFHDVAELAAALEPSGPPGSGALVERIRALRKAGCARSDGGARGKGRSGFRRWVRAAVAALAVAGLAGTGLVASRCVSSSAGAAPATAASR